MRRCSILRPKPVSSAPSSRFNETVLTPWLPLHQPYPPRFPSTPARFCSSQVGLHFPIGFSPPSASDQWWQMDFPLPGLLCEAHLVRHRLIAAPQAFGLLVQLGAGGWCVLGEAVRSAL
ncbi:hypothetical protein BDD12DRAFT_330421 [Trichophaea hybrida]|nr:hypothetical protein BDD12DRAFT_330421 [Trichophaea hybrida]